MTRQLQQTTAAPAEPAGHTDEAKDTDQPEQDLIHALTAALIQERARAADLELALATGRRIGIAVGILMATAKLTEAQAFGLMRDTSMATQRKVRDIAEEIIQTGAVDIAPCRARAVRRAS
jgi:hypothetical protein